MHMTDLFRFVNGQWLDTHEIPADRGSDGAFYTLIDSALDQVHEIVNDAEPDSRIGALFHSFMDTEAINAAGIRPLDEDFAQLNTSDAASFLRGLAALERTGISGLQSCWVEKDASSEDAIAYVSQGGLGLPNESYYREETHREVLEKYQAHIARMLGFLDEDFLGCSPQEAAGRIVELETQIAQGHWDVVSARDAVKTYNPTEFADLPPLIQTYFQALGLDQRSIIRMPDFFEHLQKLLETQDLEDFRLWTIWRILAGRAAHLSQEIEKANFDFFGTVLGGATTQRPRWKRAIGFIESFVGEDIGKVYVARHFPPSHKEAMLELVNYLVKAYDERIRQLPWMSEETKQRALEKLSLFRSKIGYPDQWRDYGDLSFSPKGEDLIENARIGNRFVHEFEFSKIGKPANRDLWFANAQMVNAFYNPVVNDITFPAAILRAPFFDPELDAAENFGAIGAVIGHEIGHGFDDQGSRYDGTGKLESWWTDEDRTAFTELTSKLVAQFDGLVPDALKQAGIESSGVNGAFTLGENIGDLGGLGIAVVAYRNYLADQGLDFSSSPVQEFQIEGADPALYGQKFNGLQRLFLSWARVWRGKNRPETAQQYLAIDPHSPAEFRCNVIAGNIAEFYEAFEVEEGSPIWIPEDQRVTIW